MSARTTAFLLAGALAIAGLVALPTAAAAAIGLASTAVRDDFDGDGVPDIAIAKGGTRVLYLRYSSALVGNTHVAYLHILGKGAPGYPLALEPGDYNGDGVDDLAVGDYAAGPGGSVFVFLGQSDRGLQPDPATTLLGPPPPRHGDVAFWEFGRDLAAGDVNGDGRDDLAVNQTAMSAAPEPVRGKALVFRGSLSGLRATDPIRVVAGIPAPVALADVNGDGHLDLVAGNYRFYTPRILVFAGTGNGFAARPTALFAGDRPFGHSWNNFLAPRAAGDVNGDGYADVVAGDPRADRGGALVVLLGGPGGLSEDRSQVVYESQIFPRATGQPPGTGDRFGADVAIGHLAAGPYPDLLVSAPEQRVSGAARAGAVFLLHGSADGVTSAHRRRVTMDTPGVPGVAHVAVHFGAALSVGDFSADGTDDALVGAPGQHSNSRTAHVERGSVVGLLGGRGDPLTRGFVRVVGAHAGVQLGVAVA